MGMSAKFTMDYVSVGQTDDARLELDAIGLDVTMETPWYGGEVAQASSTASGHALPIVNFDLSQGDYNGIALSICGWNPVMDPPLVHGQVRQWRYQLSNHLVAFTLL